MKKSLLVLSLFAGYFTSQVHGQCMMYPVSLNERIAESEVVVEGHVTNKHSFWNNDRTLIYTSSTVEVYKIFKGNIQSEEIEVITEGGIVEDIMHVANPSLQLNIGDVGIFILKGIDVISPQASNNNTPLQAVALSQGFIKYDLIDNVAISPFEKYIGIEKELYEAIEKETNTKIIVKEVSLDMNYTPSSDRNITSFSPTTITAGTFSELTINGSNFGATANKVQFRNADNGGSGYIDAPANHIVSWSNTQIKVRVPFRAGTGTIRVVSSGGTTFTSSGSLTITYNMSNVIDGSNAYHLPHLTNRNSQGGYTLTFSTNFSSNSAAVAAFQRALKTWNCGTFVNFKMNTTTTTTTCQADDAVNIVAFDNSCTLGSGTIGICHSWYAGCTSSGVWRWYLKGMDIKFKSTTNWNYGPAATSGGKYDFESISLHELGHAHQLGHIISPGKLMHHSSNTNNDNRTLSTATEITPGNSIMTRSSTFSFCSQSPMQSYNGAGCSSTGIADYEISENIQVYPNPSQGIFTLNYMEETTGTVEITVLNTLGQVVMHEKIAKSGAGLQKTIDLSNYPAGTYILRLMESTRVSSTKIVVQK